MAGLCLAADPRPAELDRGLHHCLQVLRILQLMLQQGEKYAGHTIEESPHCQHLAHSLQLQKPFPRYAIARQMHQQLHTRVSQRRAESKDFRRSVSGFSTDSLRRSRRDWGVDFTLNRSNLICCFQNLEADIDAL